ncbi:hypothetical protein AVEN_267113-1 [Araneus ventricosus]|uniref:Uncharacterized protein n=1 Tax=Araneus ventricosus TaxID=182803 RepID=A0A4Y2WAR2_ARAVE|nr:hypothetical protein AVEN_267113-1 [Araneus ventricosus]
MVDLEKSEIRRGVDEIPLFSTNAEHSKLCSLLAKEKTTIPAKSECPIQGVPEVSGSSENISSFQSLKTTDGPPGYRFS